MRSETKLMKRKVPMFICIWLRYSNPNSRSPNGKNCLCSCLYDSSSATALVILEFPWLFSRDGAAENRKRDNRKRAVLRPLLVYAQRQTMSGGQADLAVFREIVGEVRGSLGYVERRIGMPRL